MGVDVVVDEKAPREVAGSIDSRQDAMAMK